MSDSRSSVTTASSSGISFGGLLTVLFIGLKLTGHITWSWIWVFAPLWIPLCFSLGILIIVGIIAGVMRIFDR